MNTAEITAYLDECASVEREAIATGEGYAYEHMGDMDKELQKHRRLCRELVQASDGLRTCLERIAEQQPHTLAMIEDNGFVFDSIGKEPGNWQHLAFSIYTDLCQVDSIARAALHDVDAEQEDQDERRGADEAGGSIGRDVHGVKDTP